MAAVTLQDVADHAGVSLATASRVLNGSSRTPGVDISERVRHAALALGYVPNAQAQALARASTRLLGLVVHDIADPYFSSVAHGVQLRARLQGREVLLADTGMDPGVEVDAVRAFVAHRADAIVLAGSRWSTGWDASMLADLEQYRRHGGRVAVIGQRLRGSSSIVPQNRAGAAALADALVSAGHREFAVLSGPVDLVTAHDRTTGFVTALAGHQIVPLVSIAGGFSRDGGFEAAGRLVDALGLAPGRRQVCVFAVNDVMAIGAIAALRDAGLDVPGDVQIAGFHDIPTLRDFVPGLSTVRLPLSELGERAADLALGQSTAETVVEVSGEVVLRESTRRSWPVLSRRPG